MYSDGASQKEVATSLQTANQLLIELVAEHICISCRHLSSTASRTMTPPAGNQRRCQKRRTNNARQKAQLAAWVSQVLSSNQAIDRFPEQRADQQQHHE